MLDTRYIAVAIIIVTFMLVTVGHVANYAGSFEPVGWRWLGLPYAIAVDCAIVVCAWLTRNKTTRNTAFFGYSAFAIMSGAMNFAAVKPWIHPWPDWMFVSIYALFPTCAIMLLGVLARDTEKLADISKPRGILAQLSKRFAAKFEEPEVQSLSMPEPESELSFPTATAKVRYLHEQNPAWTVTHLATEAGCKVSTASRAINRNGGNHDRN